MEPNTVDESAEENKVGDIEEGGLLEPLLPSDVKNGQPPVLDDDKRAGALPDSARDGVEPASFTDLFFFADKLDYMMISIGMLCAAGAGTVMPLFSIIFGNILDAFYSSDPSREVDKNAVYFALLAVASFLLNSGQNILFSIAAERQVRRMRLSYLRSVLRQEIGWFDTTKPGELSTRIKGDSLIVQQGIGAKFGRLIQFLSMFVAGFTVGFSSGWELALVMLAVVPPLALVGSIMFSSIASASTNTQKNTAAAGGVAEEVISSIRTVAAFTGERKEEARYEDKVEKAAATAIKSGMFFGIALGLMMFLIFSSYGLGMWYGAREVARDLRRGCVGDGCKTGGNVLTVFWSILNGAMSIGQMGPNLQAVAEARGAAGHMLAVCRREPLIDSDSDKGIASSTDSAKGGVEVRNVRFAYPSRPEEDVFKDFSLRVEPGRTVAIVGASGAGKSTVVSLLERFYDPAEGVITLDGVNTKDLNIKWLRSQIALVSQEPVLFAQSIADNIANGREGATRQEIEEASRLANAYNFIMSFPNGFETEVGERGVQLSGGQKQRVAIARAILKAPAVLLLDEATSALDVESEKVVQAALDRLLATNRGTTIVIAHRLSTIRNADEICVVEGGRVVESGTHDELVAMEDSKYMRLVRLQLGDAMDDDGDKDDGLSAEAEASEGDDKDIGTSVESVPQVHHRSVRFSLGGAIVGLEGDGQTADLSVPSGAGHAQGNSIRGYGGDVDAERNAATPGLLRASSSSSYPGSETSDLSTPLLKEDKAPSKDEPAQVERSRLWELSRPEFRYFLTAIVATTFSGCVFPSFSLILSTIITFFYLSDPDKIERKASFWSSMFVVLATVMGLSTFVQVSCFSVMGEKLTMRLRKVAFKGILRQDMTWYDREENSTGALTARLATEATLVKNITGQNLSRMYQNVITIVAGVTISLVFGSPLLTLVMLAIMPFLILGAALQMKIFASTSSKSQDGVARAGKVAVQAIDGVRTVSSFNLSRRVLSLFDKELEVPLREGIKRGITDGAMLGFSTFIIIASYGFVFWWGGHRVIQGDIEFKRLLKSLMAIMMSAQTMGQTTSFLGDTAAARAAAARIFTIVDRKPVINSEDEGGQRLPGVKGVIELRKIRFRYPARPEAIVFRNFDLKVESGSTVALVGPSGSGKSTVVSLLLRFYDPENGVVLVDGVDVRSLNLSWLRAQIGLVAQEPVLFATSIADNIAYGSEHATREEVEEAARRANAHDFVESFPDGYDTSVGDKGVQLSGGQKQRIAIARAILKDPAILLLDEATSALDMESERVVQRALDKLLEMRRRTTVVIAHRLSTVRRCDKICVVRNGVILEEGSHEELIAIPDGRYRGLVDAAQGTGSGSDDDAVGS